MYVAALVAAASMFPIGVTGAGSTIEESGQVLEVRATDFAFETEERIQEGTVTLRLRNDGLVPHQAWVVQLGAGRTLRDLERDLAEGNPTSADLLPPWVSGVGGPSAVLAAQRGEVMLDLRAGHYAILCLTRLADGTPAVMKGMYHALDVEAASGRPGRMPADVSVTLTDRSLAESGRLRRGRLHVRVSNSSATTRELRVYRLAGGAGTDTLRHWLTTEVGAAPVASVGGVFGLPPGGSAVVTLLLDAGEYALVSRPALGVTGSRHVAPTFLRPVRVH